MVVEPSSTLVFGEALLDLFCDRRVIGRAPLNVTIHLARLGRRVALPTRIGRDHDGRRIEALHSVFFNPSSPMTLTISSSSPLNNCGSAPSENCQT